MPRSSKKRAARYDDLAVLVHRAIDLLEDAELIDNGGADETFARYNGYCARACSAYAYLAEFDQRAAARADHHGMRLRVLREPDAEYGDSHYWLESDDGEVLDLIFEQRKKPHRRIPYDEGKGAAVMKARHDKHLPARKDTQRIIAVVQAALD
jgi:hypothetical protein